MQIQCEQCDWHKNSDIDKMEFFINADDDKVASFILMELHSNETDGNHNSFKVVL